MIQRDFDGAEGPEPVRLSGSEFGLVVEALDRATRNRPLGPTPIEQELAMAAEHAGDLLHGLDSGPQGARAPAIQEPPGPGGGHVGPEELEVFPQEVAADRPQVVAQQLGEAGLLLLREVLGPLEQEPGLFPACGREVGATSPDRQARVAPGCSGIQ